MKHIYTLLWMLLSINAFSQYCPALGPDQLLPCGVGSTTLTADLSGCGGGIGPKETTTYAVSSIPYAAQTNTGNQLFMTDDSQQGPFAIGFNFCFFGTTYSQFYVGSNGWISFSPAQPTTFTSQPIPTFNALVPKNCIMGPWQDWHPGLGGQIRYQTSGVAPCRKLTVSWIGVPMFSCTGNQGTFHIVIYESTNNIENYIQSKPACLQWQGGTATQGVHNQLGTVGFAVPGRNSSAWTATNDAWKWTPNGATVTPVLTWYQVGNPVAIGTGPSITVTPLTPTQYTCKFVYPTCNAGWATCNAVAGLGPDTVLIVPGPPNLTPPGIVYANPSCINTCDGAISVVPIGGTQPMTISWNGPTGFSPINLCDGVYQFNIIDAAGCTVNGTVTLIDPPIPTVGPITALDTICWQSASETYSVPVQPNYTYQWSSVGAIITGQGSSTINVDWSALNAGFIPGAVQVTAYDINNCPSLPIDVDIEILNILPVITPEGPFCSYDEFVTLQATPTGGVFTGIGVVDPNFTPGDAVGTNTITYTYTQSGCVFDTTTSITVYPQPIITPIIPYNEFYEICEGDSVVSTYTVVADIPGYNEWTLLNNTTQQDVFAVTWNAAGMFDISVVHWANGCVSSPQTTSITIVQCPSELFYIPNGFTPDGDEHNNTLRFVVGDAFDQFEFSVTIYNRWGELVYESRDASAEWDGTYNNAMCQPGTYTYRIQLKNKETSKRYVYDGHVSLIK